MTLGAASLQLSFCLAALHVKFRFVGTPYVLPEQLRGSTIGHRQPLLPQVASVDCCSDQGRPSGPEEAQSGIPLNELLSTSELFVCSRQLLEQCHG